MLFTFFLCLFSIGRCCVVSIHQAYYFFFLPCIHVGLDGCLAYLYTYLPTYLLTHL